MRLRARVRQAVLLQPGVFEAPSDMPALTMGFIRPRIYLPATLDARQRLHVLLHEKAHARWRDPLMRLLSFLAISVFWFSPIVWLYGLVLQNQMERACDEAALHGLGRQSAADYCQTLLNLESRSGIGAGCAPFGKSAVKERICTALSGSRNAPQVVYRRAVSDSAALFADLRLRSDDDAARCLRTDRLRRGQRHADAERSSQPVDEPGRTEGEAADAVSPRGF